MKTEELMSISPGSAETTLLKLTSAYSLLMEEKLVKPIWIDKLDSVGKPFIIRKRYCENCNNISYESSNIL